MFDGPGDKERLAGFGWVGRVEGLPEDTAGDYSLEELLHPQAFVFLKPLLHSNIIISTGMREYVKTEIANKRKKKCSNLKCLLSIRVL